MTSRRWSGQPARWIVLLTVIAAIVALAGVKIYQSGTSRNLVAFFPNTVGLYVGDTVRVLGVKVGTIDEIEPQGSRVKVSMTYRSDISIPESAQAAIIAPTLVTGRYIQLSPPYESGPTLADGGSIPLERTAIPVPYDEVKTQLNALADQLGPRGLNKDGSVNRFVANASEAFDEASEDFNPSISELSRLAETLERGGPDLYSTIRNLAAFVDALAANTGQLSGFNRQLASVSSVLAGNRAELDSLLKTLSATVITVQRVVAENRESLRGSVTELQRVTGLLKTRQDSLAQILHAAPTALANLYNIYDAGSNSLTGNLAIPDAPDPYSLICALLTTANAPAQQCQNATRSFAGQLTKSVVESGPDPSPRSIRELLSPQRETGGER